ncbi:MAG: hypothetical protein AAB209_05505, partial [Bacteroidota bacterium]
MLGITCGRAYHADGIAIKINKAHTNKDNHFLTFYNKGENIVGRVEGFDNENGDWIDPPPPSNIDQVYQSVLINLKAHDPLLEIVLYDIETKVVDQENSLMVQVLNECYFLLAKLS